MIKKLLNGEFGLGETFWKYGIFGVLVANIFVHIIEFLLNSQIGNLRLADYYLHHFNPMAFNVWAVFLTLCYLGSLVFFMYYVIVVWLGTIRSAVSFERSSILCFWAKFLMALFLVINIWSLF